MFINWKHKFCMRLKKFYFQKFSGWENKPVFFKTILDLSEHMKNKNSKCFLTNIRLWLFDFLVEKLNLDYVVRYKKKQIRRRVKCLIEHSREFVIKKGKKILFQKCVLSMEKSLSYKFQNWNCIMNNFLIQTFYLMPKLLSYN